MSNEIQAVYAFNGVNYATAAEARDAMRTPLVKGALLRAVNGDAKFADFLFDSQDEITKAFEAGVIARVTKSEKKKLKAALVELKTLLNNKVRFLQDNADAILESFRWPSVKRMTEDEKSAATMAALVELADENAAKWIVANKAVIDAAYNAGIEKRAAPPAGGLAEYQAAKAAGPEELAAYRARKDAKVAAAKAEKDAAK